MSMLDAKMMLALNGLLARCAAEHVDARRQLSNTSGARMSEVMLAQLLLKNLCCRQVRDFMALVQDIDGGRLAARQALLRHGGLLRVLGGSPLFARSLHLGEPPTLQSLLSVVDARPGTAAPQHYGATLDVIIMALPAIRAAVEAINALGHELSAVPGAQVLAVQCGNAAPVRQWATAQRSPVRLTLLETDAAAWDGSIRALGHLGCTVALASAVDLIDGQTLFARIEPSGVATAEVADIAASGYALILAPDILHSLRSVPGDLTRGAPGLAGQLARRLRPGGRLLLGAPLASHHDDTGGFVIEVMLGCRHVTRTALDILSVADSLPHDLYRVRLLDGALAGPVTPLSAFCWLEVTRTG